MLLSISQELATEWLTEWVIQWLACVAYRQGKLERATTLIEASQVIQSPDKDHSEIRVALLNCGDVARAQGDTASAARFYARSLTVVVKGRILWEAAERLEGLAKLECATGRPARAARLFGAAQAMRERYSTSIRRLSGQITILRSASSAPASTRDFVGAAWAIVGAAAAASSRGPHDGVSDDISTRNGRESSARP